MKAVKAEKVFSKKNVAIAMKALQAEREEKAKTRKAIKAGSKKALKKVLTKGIETLEYIKENQRVKLLGLSNKGNLIFKEGINEVRITKSGKLI